MMDEILQVQALDQQAEQKTTREKLPVPWIALDPLNLSLHNPSFHQDVSLLTVFHKQTDYQHE